MYTLNQKGHVTTIFILLFPVFVFLIVATVDYSRLVFTKIKFQETLDRAIFAGAGQLTQILNQTARANRKVHEEFLSLQKKFKENSKQSIEKAKQEIQKTWGIQNQIFDEEMLPRIQEAEALAYQRAYEILQTDFPDVRFEPLSETPIAIGEGVTEELSFGEIKGVTFDPKGYRKVPKNGFEARVAFVKNFERPVLLAGYAEVSAPKPILPFLRWQALRATSAAQPYGGSLWGYALKGTKEFLYRTARIPLP